MTTYPMYAHDSAEERRDITRHVRSRALIEAAGFIIAHKLMPALETHIQLESVEHRGQVEHLLNVGFQPRVTGLEPDVARRGSLFRVHDGVELFCGCNGPLLDYAAKRWDEIEHPDEQVDPF